MFKKSFCFGGIVSPDKIHVSAEDFFSPEKGWGFLRQEDIKFDEFGEESLFGGGFSSRTDNDAKEDGKIIDTKFGARLEKENFPIRFKISVPENGNYRIKIKFFGGETGVENLSVWAMRRSLAANGIEISSGSEFSMSFCVNVSPYKPFASNKTVDEKAVYISVLGNPAVLGEIEIESANVPTIFVAGDSTLTDQNARFPYFPAESCGGWAQMLTAFINDGAAVCNQAHSGMTGTCFFEDWHWDIVFSQMKDGDVLLVQFGHNDQKRRYLRPFGGYLQNLLKYIELSRRKGAFPIIVTPISRNSRDSGGKVTDSLLDYAKACIKAGEMTGTPVLDLHARTFEFLSKIDGEKSAKLFLKGDITHTNDFGALKFASLLVEEAKRHDAASFSKHFKAVSPKDFEELYKYEIPAQPPKSRPLGVFPIPFVDVKDSPDFEWIEKAGKMELLDICVMHFHPLSPMPRAQFAFFLAKAAKIPSKPGESLYKDMGVSDWELGFANSLKDLGISENEEFFRPDDNITGEEALGMAVRAFFSKKGLSNKDCVEFAKEKGLIFDGFEPEQPISRGKITRILVSFAQICKTGRGILKDAEAHPY